MRTLKIGMTATTLMLKSGVQNYNECFTDKIGSVCNKNARSSNIICKPFTVHNIHAFFSLFSLKHPPQKSHGFIFILVF